MRVYGERTRGKLEMCVSRRFLGINLFKSLIMGKLDRMRRFKSARNKLCMFSRLKLFRKMSNFDSCQIDMMTQ